MIRSGTADLPLHNGRVPSWLYERMSKMGGAIIEAIVLEYGKSEVLKRLSDPYWFQSLGCVLGMDWHSSGITTSVMGALKHAVNPISHELGLYICGGRGKYSRQTPVEILRIADQTGLHGNELVKASKLSAKIDNTAIQDGFQLYLHSFILSNDGEWAVIQQGMNGSTATARRYHWHSARIKSFVEKPHTGIYGENKGMILNLTHEKASPTRLGIFNITKENPDAMIGEIRKLIMPNHHDVRSKDVDLKRLGSILALAYEKDFKDFESLLLLNGLGPRTLQSLTLVSEVIFGTPSRFKDPARYSFAHGGKDGHPFPVPIKVYDESISVIRNSINKAKMGYFEKQRAIKNLSRISADIEKGFIPKNRFNNIIKKERNESHLYQGRTVFSESNSSRHRNMQLSIF